MFRVFPVILPDGDVTAWRGLINVQCAVRGWVGDHTLNFLYLSLERAGGSISVWVEQQAKLGSAVFIFNHPELCHHHQHQEKCPS